MQRTSRSLRKSIVLVGRTNVGKSSLINALCKEEVAIVSDVAGTTTDVVGKAYELLGFGPVMFYDTAGLDDESSLGEKRRIASWKIIKAADLVLVVTDKKELNEWEENFIKTLTAPYIVVHTKSDLDSASRGVSSKSGEGIEDLREQIIQKLNVTEDGKVLNGLIKAKDKVLLVCPIDKSAPKGRLILPQVQILRELLDIGTVVSIVQLEELEDALSQEYDLVITDSKVVKEVVSILPKEQPLTTFSILLCRQKGDFKKFLEGAKKIDSLKDNDKVLIAEACSHTTAEDDIARQLLPKLISAYTQKNLEFDVVSGKNFPEDLQKYALVLHCGSCMLTPKETLVRIEECEKKGVDITNYGLAISKCQKVFNRVIEIFE